MNKFEELKALINEIEISGDVTKFYNRENDTAGTRLRKEMQSIKEKAQEVREEISVIRGGRLLIKEQAKEALRLANEKENK